MVVLNFSKVTNVKNLFLLRIYVCRHFRIWSLSDSQLDYFSSKSYSSKRQRQFEQAVERHTANSVDVRTVRSDDNNRHAEASDDDAVESDDISDSEEEQETNDDGAVESDENISDCEDADNVAYESNHDQSHSVSRSDSADDAELN